MMDCPICKDELKKRHHVDEMVSGIAYSYFYCVKCDRKFDENINEMKDKMEQKREPFFKDGKFQIKF